MISTGSACHSNGAEEDSYVLKNIGVPEDFIKGSIRISLAPSITNVELKEFKDTLIRVVDYLYSMKGGE